MTVLTTLPTLAFAEARLLTREWAAMVFAFVRAHGSQCRLRQ